MKYNLNLKGNQGHNVEPNKPLNQSLQSGSEKIGYMSSIGPSKNYCGALAVNLKKKKNVLKGQNRGSTVIYVIPYTSFTHWLSNSIC